MFTMPEPIIDSQQQAAALDALATFLSQRCHQDALSERDIIQLECIARALASAIFRLTEQLRKEAWLEALCYVCTKLTSTEFRYYNEHLLKLVEHIKKITPTASPQLRSLSKIRGDILRYQQQSATWPQLNLKTLPVFDQILISLSDYLDSGETTTIHQLEADFLYSYCGDYLKQQLSQVQDTSHLKSLLSAYHHIGQHLLGAGCWDLALDWYGTLHQYCSQHLPDWSGYALAQLAHACSQTMPEQPLHSIIKFLFPTAREWARIARLSS